MQDANTIKAYHFCIFEGNFCLDKRKEYYWHIPKAIRAENISKGDVVLVPSENRETKVIVIDVFRENVEETGKKYKSIIKKLETSLGIIRVLKLQKIID